MHPKRSEQSRATDSINTTYIKVHYTVLVMMYSVACSFPLQSVIWDQSDLQCCDHQTPCEYGGVV